MQTNYHFLYARLFATAVLPVCLPMGLKIEMMSSLRACAAGIIGSQSAECETRVSFQTHSPFLLSLQRKWKWTKMLTENEIGENKSGTMARQ